MMLKAERIPLATVDATVEKDLAKRYDVTGYPTLKIFRNGKVSDFKGGRTTHDIVSTMKVEKNPHTSEITTSSQKKEVSEFELSFCLSKLVFHVDKFAFVHQVF